MSLNKIFFSSQALAELLYRAADERGLVDPNKIMVILDVPKISKDPESGESSGSNHKIILIFHKPFRMGEGDLNGP